ncbi:alpha/beta hydrolase [Nocardia nova]|uniref:alpha/beta hydrolase n=1 Tax=Nocardia nova TaxID=37330 RepID=UPI0033E3E776
MSMRMIIAGIFVRLTAKPHMTSLERARAWINAPKGSATPPKTVSRRHKIDHESVNGFSCYTVTPKDRPNGRVAVYLHGGAYVNEITRRHWTFASQIADAGVKVVVPIYGLAPRYTHREAYELLSAVYTELVAPHAEPTDVVVIGDSAGGGLALGFLQELTKLQLPQPGRSILIAPWLDLTLSNPGISTIRDPWLSKIGLVEAGKAWAGDDDPSDPRLSPVNGSLRGLAPIDIYIGTRDLTLPDVLKLGDRAPDEGEISITVCPKAIHVYHLVPSPEGRAAAREIVTAVASRRSHRNDEVR